MNRRTSKPFGFSLLELLVVVAIISIVAATATLSIGLTSNSRPLQQEAARLVNTAEYAANMALFRRTRFALQLDRDGYRVMQWHKREWLPVPEHQLAAEHRLPQTVYLSIANGQGGWRDSPKHMITFDPEGTADPITIRLTDRTGIAELVIRISATSSVSLQTLG